MFIVFIHVFHALLHYRLKEHKFNVHFFFTWQQKSFATINFFERNKLGVQQQELNHPMGCQLDCNFARTV